MIVKKTYERLENLLAKNYNEVFVSITWCSLSINAFSLLFLLCRKRKNNLLDHFFTIDVFSLMYNNKNFLSLCCTFSFFIIDNSKTSSTHSIVFRCNRYIFFSLLRWRPLLPSNPSQDFLAYQRIERVSSMFFFSVKEKNSFSI